MLFNKFLSNPLKTVSVFALSIFLMESLSLNKAQAMDMDMDMTSNPSREKRVAYEYIPEGGEIEDPSLFDYMVDILVTEGHLPLAQRAPSTALTPMEVTLETNVRVASSAVQTQPIIPVNAVVPNKKVPLKTQKSAPVAPRPSVTNHQHNYNNSALGKYVLSDGDNFYETLRDLQFRSYFKSTN